MLALLTKLPKTLSKCAQENSVAAWSSSKVALVLITALLKPSTFT